jgi:hypothetical protein
MKSLSGIPSMATSLDCNSFRPFQRKLLASQHLKVGRNWNKTRHVYASTVRILKLSMCDGSGGLDDSIIVAQTMSKNRFRVQAMRERKQVKDIK